MKIDREKTKVIIVKSGGDKYYGEWKKKQESRKSKCRCGLRDSIFSGISVFCVFSSHSLKECTNHKQKGDNICFITQMLFKKMHNYIYITLPLAEDIKVLPRQ